LKLNYLLYLTPSRKKKNLFSENENEEKIEKLFETMNKWDSNAEQIPIIVDRLITLKNVHEQSVNSISTIRQIQEDHQNNSALMKSLTTNFEQLQQTFIDNVKIIEGNTSKLEQRMEELSRKMNSLNNLS